MKSIVFILIIISFSLSYVFLNHNSIIGLEFKNYKQIEYLSEYSKVSDTAVSEGNVIPKHGILHLQNEVNHLIVFNAIKYDDEDNRIFKILDTLVISNLNKTDFITIGYCEIDSKKDVNLIGLVKNTDSVMIKNIQKIWKVNTAKNKIEIVSNLNNIKCLNENFSNF